MANHMYKGTVKNVLNGMQAAFVDIGGSSKCVFEPSTGERTENLATPICGTANSCTSGKRGNAW